jgi:hypothetical protein
MPEGQRNGKDTIEGMRDPQKYYVGMRDILLNCKVESKTDHAVALLIRDVVDLLQWWKEGFHIMCSKEHEKYTHLVLRF